MSENQGLSHTQKYALGGFIFGMLFPFMAIIIDMIHKDVGFSLNGIIKLHSFNPLHYIIDMAPFVLGYVAYLIGKRVIIREGKIRAIIEEDLKAKDLAAEFANKLSDGEYEVDCSHLNDEDQLCISLKKLRDNLLENKKKNDEAQEIEKQQTWIANGLAKFTEILRTYNDDLNKLSDKIISNLVKYIDANQGGVFIYNDTETDNITLDLISTFAYDRHKFVQKSIKLGEGLLGTCAQEKEMMYMTNVPDEYIEITSGLGDSNPRSIIIIPLKVEEELLGVIEIASFHKLLKHEIEFIELMCENIASTFLSLKNNRITEELLNQSQVQTEQLNAQEEEMRQNIEELQATQEQMQKNEIQLKSTIDAINSAIAVLEYDFDGIIIHANDIFCDLFEYTLDELVGKHHSIVFDNKNIKESSAYKKFWDNLNSNIPYDGVMKRISKSEKNIIIRGVSKPIFNAERLPVKVLELSFDITESSKKEEELRKTQALMEKNENDLNQTLSALESAVAILEFDVNGVIIKSNKNYCDIMEYTCEDLKGQHHSIVFDNKNIQESDSYKKFWEDLKAGTVFDGIMKRISKSGKEVIIRGVSKPIFDINNNLVKVMEMSFDITDKKV